MVDVRSDKKEVKTERRAHPRLELHCEAVVPGLKGIQTLTDISLGGCFIEANIPGKLKLGQIITFKTKLPTERNQLEVKAKIVSQRKRGIGCQFISLQDDARDAICTCFELFKDTLPAGEQEPQWENECLEAGPEKPPAEPNIEIKSTPLSEISDTSQIKSTKSHSQHTIRLKVGIGLAVVLLSGYFIAKSIFFTSPKPEPVSDRRYAVVATPQSQTIKIQAKSAEPVDENEAQNVKTSPIEEENIHSQNVRLTEEPNEPKPGEEPIKIVETPQAFKEETSAISLKRSPDLESTDTYNQAPLNLEPETTGNTQIKKLYSIEIGPIFRKNELREATSILQNNGLDPDKIIEMGTVKVIRLFEGSYSRDLAKERLKEIHKVAESAFILPENGKFSIYVATYHDRDKAIQKSKQLEINNIKVTAVPNDIKMKGTKLIVKQVEQQNISAVEDQISTLGLPVKIINSE